MSIAPLAEDIDVAGDARSTNTNFKFAISGAKNKTLTPIRFTFTLTDMDPRLTADNGDTFAWIQIDDKKNDTNWGRFTHDQGTDTVEGGRTGFLDVSVTYSSNA